MTLYLPLYIVGTPIGNLSDMSPRALETLKEVDFIAAEDTRVTGNLLRRFEIQKPMLSYHEHNRAASGAGIITRLESGESCALCTDAGMPCVSDPGEDLIADCVDRGIEIYVIPGPVALVSALALSGLPSGRFTFEGFLSTARKSRTEHLDLLRTERRTMIFYEAPHKLLNTLTDFRECFGASRRISISREMTKLHEETWRGTLGEAVTHFSETPPRGEFVLVIDGAPEPEKASLNDAVTLAENYMSSGVSMRDAARRAASETGLSRRTVYEALLDGSITPSTRVR